MTAREDYLNKKITFEEYYAPMVTESLIGSVVHVFGIERLKIAYSENIHFNTIPLQEWDNIAGIVSRQAFKNAGDFWSIAGGVCALKLAAKIAVTREVKSGSEIMLPNYSDNPRKYYDILETLTADQLKSEWKETTKDDYFAMLECLPPIRWTHKSFMVGECVTHSPAGSIYEAFTIVNKKYYKRPAPLSGFDDLAYHNEIRTQFNLP
jgi:hypothetical protein